MPAVAKENTIALGLCSHTNVGKTSLARTLLGRDVGEVRDGPHVTEFADGYTWIESPAGETLQLWDTPGFGDCQRLLKRLSQSGNPFVWLLTHVWDRWRDKPFYLTQKALRNLQDESDVVVYMVNASEPPQSAGYVESEFKLLELMKKPVIVLVNQLGSEQTLEQEAADVAVWKEYLGSRYSFVADVLPLDAFSRCWVQEYCLLEAVHAALQDQERRVLMQGLCAAWQREKLDRFEKSMRALAEYVARCAVTRQLVTEPIGVARTVLDTVTFRNKGDAAVQQAEAALRDNLRRHTQEMHAKLAGINGVDLTALDEFAVAVKQIFHPAKGVSAPKVSVLTGFVGGALAGLGADLMSGGLSLGMGAIIGGITGALGGGGAAYGYNRVYGKAGQWVDWDAEALTQIFRNAVLFYLLVAHLGRGRGPAVLKREHPRWASAVPRAIKTKEGRLLAIWNSRKTDAVDAGARQNLSEQLTPVMTDVTWTVVEELYPWASRVRDMSTYMARNRMSPDTPRSAV